MVKILDGQKLAEKWSEEIKKDKTQPDTLAGVLIGTDPASVLYLKLKEKTCKNFGIKFELHKLPSTTSQQKIVDLIEKLNKDKKVDGILVQLPLPNKFNADEIVNLVNENKDVDGLSDFHIQSREVLPATAAGIVKMLQEYKISARDKKVVMIGFTRLLNIPLSLYLNDAGAEVVVLQEGTKKWDELKSADIIISAAGKAKIIKNKDVREGAIIIDAGITKIKNKIYGDADYDNLLKKVSAITPVPGGVGPLTLIALMSNLKTLKKLASAR